MHIPGKAMPLLLNALAQLGEPASVRVDILGQGPETQACRAIAHRLRLDQVVSWCGQVPRTEAVKIMARADVLVHTSLKEGTPSVVVEALSLGLPVICHDISGMALAVTSECGIKIPLRNPETSIAGFARALESLAQDGKQYERLSAGALAKARELTWDRKVGRFSEAYYEATAHQRATNEGCDKPTSSTER
jgi:glycosyltransferase involved in cell wall biosynthesis